MRFVVKVLTLSYMSIMILFDRSSLKCHCDTTDFTLVTIPTGESYRRYFRKFSNPLTNRTTLVGDLRHGAFQFVPEGIFRSYGIEVLDFEDNELTALPNDLARLTNLGHINLVDNRITDISHVRVVNDLPHLEYLRLSRNPLKSLNGLRVNSLVTLEADYCEIEEIGDSFLDSLPSLKTLNLTGNPLNTVRKLISDNLTELLLTDCHIKELPHDTFKGLHNLEYLNLCDNALTTLPDDIFSHNNNLVDLNLRKNLFDKMKNVWFDDKRYLRNLDMSENDIKTLNETSFAQLFALENLDLSDNSIVALSRLKTSAINVNLAKNSIENQEFWDLSDMDKLRNLDLSKNQLDGDCDEFKSATLRILDLSYNGLKRLKRNSFSKVPNLINLNLKGNQFTRGNDIMTFDDNKILVDIELNDNPWNCNCSELFKTYDFLVRGKRTTSPSLVCWTPEIVKGDSWWDVCSTDWIPMMKVDDQIDVSRTWLIVISSVFGICLFVGTFFYIVYTFRKYHSRPNL